MSAVEVFKTKMTNNMLHKRGEKKTGKHMINDDDEELASVRVTTKSYKLLLSRVCTIRWILLKS